MANRNEWTLYKRKCDFSGESIISAYPPDSNFKIYKNEIWWSDQWNAMDYGMDFDFNRPFFEQYAELQKMVPREGTSVFRSENCDYNGHIRESRNCYLNALVYRCEDIDYCYWMNNVRDSMDCYLAHDSELCYWCIDIANCYECAVVQEAVNCSECYFSFQIRGCKHCLFCINLADKEYHIFNEPCTREEFEKAKSEIFSGSGKSFSQALARFEEMKKNSVHRFVHSINCENSTGDHIANLKNCRNCFESYQSEDCVNCISLQDSRDVRDCYSAGWPGCDRVSNSVVTRGSTDIAFCIYTFFSSSLRYCDSSNDCDSCFGCIGLQHKKFCILNKQYTADEYRKMLPRIMAHMEKTGETGQFFPPTLSLFAYNESAAQDYFPLSQKEAQALGYRWREQDKREYMPATDEILACEQCGKNYKIIPRELKFYKHHGLPIHEKCPGCRHAMRFKMRNPMVLVERICDKCGTKIQSSYSAKSPERVYCESCFNAEIH